MTWMRVDVMIKGWLTTTMERDIRTNVRFANISAEIWTDLEERFEKECAPRAYELKQSLNATRQNATSVSAYCMKLRDVWDELQTMYAPAVVPKLHVVEGTIQLLFANRSFVWVGDLDKDTTTYTVKYVYSTCLNKIQSIQNG